MELGVRLGTRVLLGHIGPELHVLPDGSPKRLIRRHPGFVERFQVGGDKTLSLLVGDLQTPVDVDDVSEPELLCETGRIANDSAVNQVK
jgi:hypothetical protein